MDKSERNREGVVLTLTYPAPLVLSLEDEARQLGQRYSRTSAEREAIAVDVDALLTRYELQGGKFSTKWLERHMGVNHGTAVNLRRAGRAQRRGAAPGPGVSRLAIVGRWLENGYTLVQAYLLLDNAEARKKAAEDANIGVASVKYASSMTGEMADGLTTLTLNHAHAGLTPPELPELMVKAVQLAAKATPAQLRNLELGEAIGTQAPAEKVRSDFYSHLARLPGGCDVPGCVEPWTQYHHWNTTHGRRSHDLKQYNVLRLCHRHHQTGKVEAAHGIEGERAWMERHWGSREAVLELCWERAARFAEELRGH